MNTDTPRTDDEESRIQCDLSSMKLDGWNAAYHEMKEHAQELERELAAAREKLAKAGVGDYKADYFLGELTETGKLRSELKAVTEQRDRLAENNNRIIELLKDGLQTDGSHHKQWYLNEVLKLINADIAKDVEMHWTHDKGIAP